MPDDTDDRTQPSPAHPEAEVTAVVPQTSPFDSPPTAAFDPAVATSSNDGGDGTTFAGFTLKRLLGEGGMGAVYEAEQHHPRRTVALKIVRGHLMTPAMLRRFQVEVEVLARLQHPGIAAVYQAGTTPAPYFAMELVRMPSSPAIGGGGVSPQRAREGRPPRCGVRARVTPGPDHTPAPTADGMSASTSS